MKRSLEDIVGMFTMNLQDERSFELDMAAQGARQQALHEVGEAIAQLHFIKVTDHEDSMVRGEGYLLLAHILLAAKPEDAADLLRRFEHVHNHKGCLSVVLNPPVQSDASVFKRVVGGMDTCPTCVISGADV